MPDDFEIDPNAATDIVMSVATLKASRLAQKSKDTPANLSWKKNPLIELFDDAGKSYKVWAAKINNNDSEQLVAGNIDDETYVISKDKLKLISGGLNAFKKEDLKLPPINEKH